MEASNSKENHLKNTSISMDGNWKIEMQNSEAIRGKIKKKQNSLFLIVNKNISKSLLIPVEIGILSSVCGLIPYSYHYVFAQSVALETLFFLSSAANFLGNEI